MKVAVLSGKGGTGKTFVSVNLAAAADRAVYVDCDVEEPNGRLFFKPVTPAKAPVYTPLPTFDAQKCTGCRTCVNFCRFNALAFTREKPVVFAGICHGCGGCKWVCPNGAVGEQKRRVGVVETGLSGHVRVVTGILNPGEPSGVPVVKAALKNVKPDPLIVIDCPPGSSCSVMESVADADFCLLVAEPTVFGLHNLKMVAALVRLFRKPFGVVINKIWGSFEPLESFCEQNGIPILCRITYSVNLAQCCAKAQIAVFEDDGMKNLFSRLLDSIQKELSP